MKFPASPQTLSLLAGGVIILAIQTTQHVRAQARDKVRKKLLEDRERRSEEVSAGVSGTVEFHPCFRLHCFLSSPVRFSKQLIQRFNTLLFCPHSLPEVAEKLHKKVLKANAITSDVVVICQCKKCKIVARNGGGHSTVCHCSVCRYHNGGTANPWKAVDRNSCFILGSCDSENENVAWTDSSFFSRRARCVHCNSVLMMDYEFFEPNTVWLGNPSIVIRDNNTGSVVRSVPIQEYEDGGLVDADVCWDSRNVPVAKDGLLTDFGGFFETNCDVQISSTTTTSSNENMCSTTPLGKEQWTDINWKKYFIDSGKL
jgi:hypothetical protein